MSRASTSWLLLLLLAGGVLVFSALYPTGDAEPPVPASGGRAPASLAGSPESGEPTEQPPVDAGDREALERDRAVVVSCLQRASGAALQGVRLYAGLEPSAGPSDEEGILEVPTPPAGRVTLWAEGWLAVTASGEALPSEVAFDAADAAVELRFEGATNEHRLLRSVLQPRAPSSTPEGPWTPAFEERALDLWVADRVPPGDYDLYLWVTFPDGEPRPFSQRAFVVTAGESTRLSIDLAAPRDPADLESDS